MAKLKGKYGGNNGGGNQKSRPAVRKGTGKSGGVDIPRYDYPGFRMIETPDSGGLIQAWRGGKLFRDGIIRYPMTADIDPVRAAKAQALVDYNNCPGVPAHRADMAKVYGEAYLKEFERLKRAKNGPPARWK